MLIGEPAPSITSKIVEARSMSTLALPELGHFTSKESVKLYPWRKPFDEAKDDPFVILHTSGSTGVPKPVYVTHGVFASNDAHQLIPSFGGKPTFGDLIRGERFFLALPLFHSANLTFTLGFNVFFGVTCVLPPPVPMTVDVLNRGLTYGRVQGSLIPPSLLVDLYNNPEYLTNMVQRLQFVSYVGGKLPKQIGDCISSKMRLITLIGSTETKLLPIEVDNDPMDWEYIPISSFLGHEFRPSKDNLSELVIVRKESLSLFQGVFSIFPGLQEYPMKDLYKQHPTKQGSWAFQARADDIIALTNAEKVNPVTMENIIMSHPAVKSAIIGGHGQFQTSLLVEPTRPCHTENERVGFIREIWPTVKRASLDCPAHGRIMKDFILVASPTKPLPKADKETVQRSAAMRLYADEFNSLYESHKTKQLEMAATNNKAMPREAPPKVAAPTDNAKTLSANAIISMQAAELDAHIEAVLYRALPSALLKHLGPAMVQILHATTPAQIQPETQHHHASATPDAPNTSHDLLHQAIYTAIQEGTYLEAVTDDEADLFECGLDSLQATALVSEINAYLCEARPDLGLVSSRVLYENCTVAKLLAVIGGG
ncbi:MAG: hypothetical protein Q9195_004982 [Heterodermia aff. obscurata]